jgi:predicted small lipoprotein YifL
MRAAAICLLVAILLQACGSKGALFLPPETNGGQQNNSKKQE